jgi:hypothetical protein
VPDTEAVVTAAFDRSRLCGVAAGSLYGRSRPVAETRTREENLMVT